ncbi:hypothetical protein FQN57_003271 [Myotisia sp. PD_48]|nr:hypothetical protein FQN57_003271 [Myotisia sp. PD_48]
MPHATEEMVVPDDPSTPGRIVLCFDGTGNEFHGKESDTNVVKIYQMLEKNTPRQFHYYQPGIGTYVKGNALSSGFTGYWRHIKSKLIKMVDQGVGTSFEDHVLCGYRFIMRYYSPGDHIYIFGFSRGAYTARFLAEMVHELGLLSTGNEEMVHFAWKTFSSFQQTRYNVPQTAKGEELARYMKKFHDTFCRPQIRVHFLGLFDCVNSVGQFEIPFRRTSYKYIASPASRYIRHAVAIHERRVKFKPALFLCDKKEKTDLKEVWFAGNHGDVGGGWGFEPGQNHLLSDTALNWMIQEVLTLEKSESKLSFTTTNVEDIVDREAAFPGIEEPGTNAYQLRRKTNQPHDMLKIGHGVALLKANNRAELLPLFTRLELEKGKWIPRRFPPNLGAPRDIPNDAVIHPSVNEMVKAGIIDAESIPKKGGDNSHFPTIASISGTWKRMRKHALLGMSTPKDVDSDEEPEDGGQGPKPEQNGIQKGDAQAASNGVPLASNKAVPVVTNGKIADPQKAMVNGKPKS